METLAEVAYEAWRARIWHNIGELGCEGPVQWRDLSPGGKAAWIQAMHAAVKKINLDPDRYRGY